MNIFTPEMFIFAILEQKMDFEQLHVRMFGVAPTEFDLSNFLHSWYSGKVVLKLQKLCRTNIFTTEMFIFAIFVEQINGEQR